MTYVVAFCALAMTGIIWYVQLVQYPLFAHVGAEVWFAYHAEHERRTGWVVAPLMIGELGGAAVLVVIGHHEVLAVAGLLLAATTWVLTFTLAVPLHRRLNRDHEAAMITRLVQINWLRTAVWSAHGVIALVLL